MLNVAIIEDETLAAEDLEKTLNQIGDDIKVLSKLESVTSAIEWLNENEVDLILSDIELGDGLSFDIFNQIKKNIPIIITTAYDQYAIRAFKENSIDYLLKPVDKTELETAINKYKSGKSSHEEFNMEGLLEALRPLDKPYQERFLVTLGDKIRSIPESEVAYFFSEDRYTFLVTTSSSQHIINNNLAELETQLNPKNFYRINRKFIISYQAIKGMVSYSKSRVKIELVPPPPNAMDVVVSVERSGPFKKWLNR